MDEAELLAWAGREGGRPVSRLERVGYGSSRATYIAVRDPGPDLVMRVDTGDGPMAGTELSLGREAEIYRALAGTGVRIPTLYAVSDDAGALLVERAPGEHEIAGLPEAERALLLDDFIDALAELHSVDPGALDLPSYRRPVDGPSHALAELDLWERILLARTSRPWPLARFTIRFLRDRAPASVERTVFCHGDVGPGNFMFDGVRVTALLDWEFSHIGDPMDDLAWWVFRGHDMKGGCGDLAAQLRRWSAATGLPVDSRRIDYYRIMVMLRWLVSVATAIDAAGPGIDLSVHHALVPVLSVRLPAAMAAYEGTDLGQPPSRPDPRTGPEAGIIDALESDLTRVVGPAVSEPEARRRVGAASIYLSHLRAADAFGAGLAAADAADLAAVTGAPGGGEGAETPLSQRGSVLTEESVRPECIAWFWRNGLRQSMLWPLAEARATAPATVVPPSEAVTAPDVG